jgi:hypothetical protein
MGWKSFEDLAENDYGSIWVERNREKIGMNRFGDVRPFL